MRDDLDFPRVFLDYSRRKLVQETSNSIGKLLLHLNGNLQQWMIVLLGGGSGERNRPAEFAERQQIAIHALRDRLELTLRGAEEIFPSPVLVSTLPRFWRRSSGPG